MRQNLSRATALAVAAFVSLPIVSPLACSVPEDIELSVDDEDRMRNFDLARAQGLAEALVAESADERETVSWLFSQGFEAIETIPDGDYRCRTIKLGGISPLVVYDFFDCQISGDGTRIEKTSGSQRFNGDLIPVGQALFYQGAGHYNDDPLLSYGEDPEQNQVGCLYRVGGGDGQYRLELPFPLRESTHDVIELVPQY